jgi:cytochrome c oxidase subunit 2
MAGPTWRGLAGSRVTLGDGTEVVADVDYLRRSITDPRAELVAGYGPLMPDLDLTEREVDDVVAYLRTL